MPGRRPTLEILRQYAALGQVGMEMAAPIALGAALDFWLNWMPWGTIVGAVLGLVGGMAHLVAILNKRAGRSEPQRDEM